MFRGNYLYGFWLLRRCVNLIRLTGQFIMQAGTCLLYISEVLGESQKSSVCTLLLGVEMHDDGVANTWIRTRCKLRPPRSRIANILFAARRIA